MFDPPMDQHAPAAQSRTVNSYLRTRVLTASPEELRLMLLDGAVKFARQGREGLERTDFQAMYEGVSQCRNIVFELLTTVREDVDPELARNVKALYTFLYVELSEASHGKDLARFGTVIDLLEFERETWVLLMRKLVEERGGGAGAIREPAMAGPGAARASISVEG